MTRIIGGVFVVCSLPLVACGTSGTSEVGSAKTATMTVAPTTTEGEARVRSQSRPLRSIAWLSDRPSTVAGIGGRGATA